MTSNSPSGYGSTPVTLTCGEHVATVWWDENKEKLQWYLGIVSETVDSNNSDKIKISYLYRSGQSASTWKFPESAQETKTPFRNIIYFGFFVRYPCISVIKCIINDKDLEKIEAVFREYLSQMNEDPDT